MYAHINVVRNKFERYIYSNYLCVVINITTKTILLRCAVVGGLFIYMFYTTFSFLPEEYTIIVRLYTLLLYRECCIIYFPHFPNSLDVFFVRRRQDAPQLYKQTM